MQDDASLFDPDSAEGGAWLSEAEVLTEVRRSPHWMTADPWLVPAALVLLLLVWILSYFGIPAALLDAGVLGLVLGHLWPRWVARDSVQYWAPAEGYVHVRVGPRAVEVSSGDRREAYRVEDARSVHFAALGWLLRFEGAPPLWLPARAFSGSLGERVATHLSTIPRETPGSLRAALFALLFTFSLSGTAVWYWAVR
jgi:hypothetical protein